MAESKKVNQRKQRTPTARGAAGVDPLIKASNLRRLNRIEGQVRGLIQMTKEDRYCVDILIQIAAVREGLRVIGRETMRNHLRHCVSAAFEKGPEAADASLDEVLDLIYKNTK